MRTNFVGRLVVSAMTQTPASGPLGPDTTPPMSSASTATAPASCAWPPWPRTAACTAARPSAITVAHAQAVVLIARAPFAYRDPTAAPSTRAHCRAAARRVQARARAFLESLVVIVTLSPGGMHPVA